MKIERERGEGERKGKEMRKRKCGRRVAGGDVGGVKRKKNEKINETIVNVANK